MMNKILLMGMVWLSACSVHAQMSAATLLATAWDDPAVLRQREQQAYLENNEFRMPMLRRLELRTQTRDLDPKQQDYAIRLSANGFGMRRTQESIYGAMKELSEADRQLLVQDALLDRYELLLDLYFDKRQLALVAAQKKVLQDKKAVYTQQLALGLEQDLDDFFRAEEDLMQLERKKNEALATQKSRQFLLQLFTGKKDSVTVDTFLAPNDFMAFVRVANPVSAPSVRREEVQAKLAALKVEMEQMEGRNLLSFLQFRYSGNAKDLLQDRFNLGAGVNLPWPNTNRLREQERQLAALEATTDLENERQAVQRATTAKALEMGSYLEQHLLLEQQIATFEEQYSPEKLHANGLENPETLLRVRESVLKLRQEQLEIEKNLYQSYIEMLGESGMLQQSPAVNWLSPNLELIGR